MHETTHSVVAEIGMRPNSAAAGESPETLRFHRLVYLEHQSEVTVGRPDRGEYVVLSADVAQLLQWLVAGVEPDEAATRYQREFGEDIDVDDFVESLGDLGFLRAPGEPVVAEQRIRWQRLSAVVFSPIAACCYLLVVAAACWLVVKHPALAPRPRNFFFGGSLMVFALVMLAGQLVLIMLHEGAHALAGRRLGLASRLSIGRRFYFVVFETNLDGLVTVPPKKRALPILAGMLCDIVVAAGLTVIAATLTGHPELQLLSSYLLALVYLSFLRIAWQFWFFLETDIYYLITTVLGCINLHEVARQAVRNRLDRARGRPETFDPDSWHPSDRAVARWFAKLMVLGYLICGTVLVLGMVPVVARLGSIITKRIGPSGHRTVLGVLDASLFVAFAFSELLFSLFLAIRQRRRSRQSQSPIASQRKSLSELAG